MSAIEGTPLVGLPPAAARDTHRPYQATAGPLCVFAEVAFREEMNLGVVLQELHGILSLPSGGWSFYERSGGKKIPSDALSPGQSAWGSMGRA